jgi:hypothetical protein
VIESSEEDEEKLKYIRLERLGEVSKPVKKEEDKTNFLEPMTTEVQISQRSSNLSGANNKEEKGSASGADTNKAEASAIIIGEN